MPTTQRAGPASAADLARARTGWVLGLYRTAVGKKYVMALTGIALMGYVLAHMLGNLKLYFGAASLNEYAEFLRRMGEPLLPHTWLLWGFRIALIAAFVFHIHAAWGLTVINRRARPPQERYRSERDYVVATFASRTMRWTGVIVGLFVLYHLADLTWGMANPEFVRGQVYANVVASFSRVPVALLYVAANLALAIHLYHGSWSLFQSMGWNNPRWNPWRQHFAIAFATMIGVGNISFPVMVQLGVVS